MKFQHPLLPIIILTIITLTVFSNIFANQFVGDDFDFIHNWIAAKSSADIPSLLLGELPPAHQGNFRPLKSLSLWLVFQLFGFSTFGFHLFAILVHLSITILIFYLAYQITKNNLTSFLTALFFSTHPIHTEAITFITASFDTLAFVFLFLSFLFFIRSLTHPASSRSLFTGALVFASLAFLTNETSLVLPLLLSLYCFLFISSKSSRKISTLLTPFWFLALLHFIVRLWLNPNSPRNTYLGINYLHTLLLSLKSFLAYIHTLILPNHLSLVRTFPPGISNYTLPQHNLPYITAQSFSESTVILSLSVLVSMLFLIYRTKASIPGLSFALSWLLISLLPVLNLIPGSLIFSERYAYLASFGYCLLLGILASLLLCQMKLIALSLIFIVVLSFSYLTLNRNQVWQSQLSLWQHTAAEVPSNGVVAWQLGQAYQLDEKPALATATYLRALKLLPGLIPVHLNLAAIYRMQNNYPQTIYHLSYLHQLEPTNDAISSQLSLDHYNYAQDLIASNRIEAALVHLHAALGYNPNFYPAQQALSQVCLQYPSACSL